MQSCFIIKLPDEVLVEEIMLMLGIEDVVTLRRVCADSAYQVVQYM